MIGGAVTDLGTSSTQAVVFGLSFGLGGLSGAFKGAGVTEKVASLASKSVYTRSFLAGSKLGLRTLGLGAIGYSGYRAGTSGDPVAGLSRLAGQILSYGGAYKIGEASGYGVGAGAQKLSQKALEKLATVDFSTPRIGGKKASFRTSRGRQSVKGKNVFETRKISGGKNIKSEDTSFKKGLSRSCLLYTSPSPRDRS